MVHLNGSFTCFQYAFPRFEVVPFMNFYNSPIHFHLKNVRDAIWPIALACTICSLLSDRF